MGQRSLALVAAFFGTTAATRGAGMVRDVADAEGLDVAPEAADFWQGYVDESRCHMRPVWPGFRVAVHRCRTSGDGSVDPACNANSEGGHKSAHGDVDFISVQMVLGS